VIWREKRVLLGILAVLLLANTVFFFTYRVQYVNRLNDLDARQEDAKSRLAQAQRARLTAEQQLASLHKSQADLQALYTERWSTQTERFTSLIAEVKRLAAASQLAPPTYAFTSTEAKGVSTTAAASIDPRASQGTTAVGIAFTVEGTYEQIRRLINLLELSDQFVIIDSINLGNNSGPAEKALTMNIHLKTLFRDPRVNAFASQPARRQL
jgi:hypothetical protein